MITHPCLCSSTSYETANFLLILADLLCNNNNKTSHCYSTILNNKQNLTTNIFIRAYDNGQSSDIFWPSVASVQPKKFGQINY